MQRRSSNIKILGESREVLLQIESNNQLTKGKVSRVNKKKNLDKEMQQIKILHKTIFNNQTLHQINSTVVNTAEIISILKKLTKDRSIADVRKIASYLSTTKIMNKLQSENLSLDSLNRILLSISYFFAFEEFTSSKYVFYQGDEPYSFYIVLDGEADVLIDEYSNKKITADEYFEHLIQVKSEGDIALLDKIIRQNIISISIEFHHINIIDKLYELLKIKLSINETIKTLFNLNDLRQKLIDLKNKVTVLETKLDIKCPYSNNYLDECIDKSSINISLLLSDDFGMQEVVRELNRLILMEISSELKNIDLSMYTYYFEDNAQKYKIKITKRRVVNTLTKNQVFGDIGIEGSKSRTASIRAKSKLTVGVISSQAYREYISFEAIRITNKSIQFIYEKYYFNSIQRNTFIQKHFPNFSNQNFKKSVVLFNEDDKITKLFLINNGTVQYKMKKTIIELSHLYKKLLVSTYKRMNNLDISSELKDKVKTLLIENKKKEMLFTPSLGNNVFSLLNEKIDIVVNNKQDLCMIGMEEVFLNKRNWLSKCLTISNLLQVYEINYDLFIDTFRDGNTHKVFNNKAVTQLIITLEQIDSIRLNYYKRKEELIAYNKSQILTDYKEKVNKEKDKIKYSCNMIINQVVKEGKLINTKKNSEITSTMTQNINENNDHSSFSNSKYLSNNVLTTVKLKDSVIENVIIKKLTSKYNKTNLFLTNLLDTNYNTISPRLNNQLINTLNSNRSLLSFKNPLTIFNPNSIFNNNTKSDNSSNFNNPIIQGNFFSKQTNTKTTIAPMNTVHNHTIGQESNINFKKRLEYKYLFLMKKPIKAYDKVNLLRKLREK